MKTRLSESDAEAEEPTNHKARNRTLWLVYFSASLATLTMQFSLDHKRRSHERDRCSASDSIGLIFTRSYRFTLLITTPTTTPSLVKDGPLFYEGRVGEGEGGGRRRWFSRKKFLHKKKNCWKKSCKGVMQEKKSSKFFLPCRFCVFVLQKFVRKLYCPAKKKIIMARKIAQPPRKNNGPALSKQFNKRTQWKSQPWTWLGYLTSSKHRFSRFYFTLYSEL